MATQIVRSELDTLKEEFQRGTIKRREFLTKLLALGISAPTAYILLGEMSEPSVFASELNAAANPDNLHDHACKLIKIAEKPQVVEVIKEIQDAPEGKRQELAEAFVKKMEDPAYKKQLGLKEEPGFRITTRVFEDPGSPKILAQTSTAEKPGTRATCCGSLGYIVCVTIGSEC